MARFNKMKKIYSCLLFSWKIKLFHFSKIPCKGNEKLDVSSKLPVKPNVTNRNLNDSAEKGSLKSIIGFVVIKAEDHKIIKKKGNNLII